MSGGTRTGKLTLLILVCQICLYTPAACADIPAVPPARPAASGMPSFAGTGLLVRPDESAEELLLRAHQRDAGATLLTVVGYQRGQGGFPKEPLLASSWAYELPGIGAPDAFALAIALLAAEGVNSTPPGAWAAACEQARREERLTAALKQGEIFDLERECGKFAAPAGAAKDKFYEGMRNLLTLPPDLSSDIRRIRELRSRPIESESWSFPYNSGTAIRPEDMLFFLGTTHDPARQPPDWDAGRIIDFFDAQRVPLRDEEGFAVGRSLVEKMSDDFLKRLSGNPARALEVVRRAHGGDLEAAGDLVRLYLEGYDGFPKSRTLASGWMSYGAYRGHSLFQIRLALECLVQNIPETALSWIGVASNSSEKRPEVPALVEVLDGLGKEQKAMAGSMVSGVLMDMRNRAAAPAASVASGVSPAAPAASAVPPAVPARESAEAVLLRAHRFEPDAMIRSFAGYSRGTGGFPKEPMLADAWMEQIQSLGVPEADVFAQLLYWTDRKADGTGSGSEGFFAAYCAAFGEDSPAARFWLAGVPEADEIRRICGQIQPGGKPSVEQLNKNRKEALHTRETMLLLRELRSRPVAREDLRRLFEVPLERQVFFLATAHDPATEPPDWSSDRLLAFLRAQREFLPSLIFPPADPEMDSRLYPLLFAVLKTLDQRLSEDPARALEVIRRAHEALGRADGGTRRLHAAPSRTDGSDCREEKGVRAARDGGTDAINLMCRYYEEGSFGFADDWVLARNWMRAAALHGDGLNRLLAAISDFASSDSESALGWAELTLKIANGDECRLARYLITKIEARAGLLKKR